LGIGFYGDAFFLVFSPETFREVWVEGLEYQSPQKLHP
jgi:hypothetical protein